MSRGLVKQTPAEFVRVLLAGGCQFVHETFAEKSVLRSSHRSPEADRNARLGPHVIHLNIGNRVRQIGDAFDAGRIEIIFCAARKPRFHDRGTRNARRPGNGPAIGVESAREFGVGRRPVIIVLRVILARPRQLSPAGPALWMFPPPRSRSRCRLCARSRRRETSCE